MKRLLSISLLIVTLIQCKPSDVTKSVTTLENTYWKLSEVNGNPVITPEGSKEVHFILTAKGDQKNIKGFAGCNSITGSYTLSGSKIKFVVASTMMMCPPDQMEIENFFTKALTAAETFEIEGDVLELYAGNTSLADFKAVYLK